MLAIPDALRMQFDNYLQKKRAPKNLHWAYKKWLRYYLDFRQKYHLSARQKENLPKFINKLREKKQTQAQQDQATVVVRLVSVAKLPFCYGDQESTL